MNEKQMKERVLSFGVPPVIESSRNLQIVFEDKDIKGTNEKGYHCKVNDVKFCLYDIEKQKPIFSMDFFASNPDICKLMSEEIHIRLELLYVHDKSMKNKGIATYYIRKLQQYAIENEFKYITVHPNPNAKNFKGNKGLSKTDLIKFYTKLSTAEMPIKILEY